MLYWATLSWIAVWLIVAVVAAVTGFATVTVAAIAIVKALALIFMALLAISFVVQHLSRAP